MVSPQGDRPNELNQVGRESARESARERERERAEVREKEKVGEFQVIKVCSACLFGVFPAVLVGVSQVSQIASWSYKEKLEPMTSRSG